MIKKALSFLVSKFFTSKIFNYFTSKVYRLPPFQKLNTALNNIQRQLIFLTEQFKIEQIKPATGQLREIQLETLKLAKTVKQILDQEKINYFLSYGSLLGCVRHRGFIPWDDDFDIEMDRQDYNRLFKIAQKKFLTLSREKYYKFFVKKKSMQHQGKIFFTIGVKDYFVLSYLNEQSQFVKIDVFPLDYIKSGVLPEDYVKCLTKKKQPNNFTSSTPTKHMAFTSFTHPIVYQKNEFIKYEEIFPTKNALFEGIAFKIPNQPEKLLLKQYGDFMSFPKNFGYPKHHFWGEDRNVVYRADHSDMDNL